MVILNIGIYLLAFNFLLHLITRAYWLARMGLHYIFPEGIQLNKIKDQKPFFHKNINFIRNEEESLLKIDKYCGLILSNAIINAILVVGLACLVFLVAVIPTTISENLKVEDGLYDFIEFISLLLSSSLLIYLFDLAFFGLLRKVKYLSYVIYPIFYIYDLISFRRFIQPQLWVFNTNIHLSKRIAFSVISFLIVVFFVLITDLSQH